MQGANHVLLLILRAWASSRMTGYGNSCGLKRVPIPLLLGALLFRPIMLLSIAFPPPIGKASSLAQVTFNRFWTQIKKLDPFSLLPSSPRIRRSPLSFGRPPMLQRAATSSTRPRAENRIQPLLQAGVEPRVQERINSAVNER